MSVLKDIAKGAAWSTAGQWTVQLFQFATSIVLARMLTPKDYGLVAMSAAFTGLVALFANLGFGPALVQRRSYGPRYVDVAFTATAGAAALLFVVAWAAAPLVGRFYGEPAVVPIVRLAAWGLLLSPLNAVLVNLLTRDMRFRELAGIEIVCSLTSQTTALTAAFTGFGVWSLVVGSLAFQLIRMPLVLWRTRHLPRLHFDRAYFRDLLSFGGHLMGFNFLNYFSRNADNLIIGRFLGPVALGYYDLAYQIMLKPLQNVSGTLGQPLFAGLASLQHDKAQAAEIYRKVVMAISLLTFPMMFGLAAVAPEAVHVLFGAKWAPAIPVLQILCLVGAMQSVGTTVGAIYQSQGRTDVMFRVGLLVTVVYCLAFLLGVRWGVVGVAGAYAFAGAGLWIYTHHVANRIVALRNRDFWPVLVPAVGMSGIMAAIVLGFRFWIRSLGLPIEAVLATCIGVGALIYSLLLRRSTHREIVAVRGLVAARFRRA